MTLAEMITMLGHSFFDVVVPLAERMIQEQIDPSTIDWRDILPRDTKELRDEVDAEQSPTDQA